jgi:hypothetical protein
MTSRMRIIIKIDEPPRLHVLLECSSSHLADLLGQLGSMEKKEGNT